MDMQHWIQGQISSNRETIKEEGRCFKFEVEEKLNVRFFEGEEYLSHLRVVGHLHYIGILPTRGYCQEHGT
ncbi:hypothetical protein M0802_001052 [Mischocyttarus mexicanus]|nr:hypothetical protein M0802_001052 [Mischocyttarus mexicanus]